MAEKSVFQVDLPEGLKSKLSSLQRKLFVVDTAIALSGLIAGLVVSWMLVYFSDRFWETPFWARGLFALGRRGGGRHFCLAVGASLVDSPAR